MMRVLGMCIDAFNVCMDTFDNLHMDTFEMCMNAFEVRGHI